MNSITRFLLGLFLICLLPSCLKESVTKEHPEFEGNWRHKLDTERATFITVNADSRGYTNTYNYQTGELLEDGPNRKWHYKKGKLYFGWLAMGSDVYSVDQEPEIATDLIMKGLDTAYLGDRYMVIEGDLFTDRD